ncbi:MAG: Undecaprenyl/decaprenyl-phosphate alpha-N-acetylglucosaminyl 1-phosphate transferase [Candidatus Hydrogenedentes bacterium]|nr:Undecaprenyl/decaprenyl-phosphate alpha-N-acetylglucosaminyl 1-phosphate transferase [Candidatus Hydrogenedentota bacterium]
MKTEQNWYLIFAYALGVSFLISIVLTDVVRRLALRWNILDHPGERKVHKAPIPLMGGVAIVTAFYLVIGGNLLALWSVRTLGDDWLDENILAFLGANVGWKLGGIFAGSMVIFVLGVIDDIKALRPETKLAGQIVAALILVFSGTRLELFIPNLWIGGAITLAWVVVMTNSMNLLDNMDGLSAGVAIIAAFSFFLCLWPHGDAFVCVLLMVFAGSVAGFLYHNLNPARIFMGDAGAMFCGYMLATVGLLGTFHTETTPSRVAVAAPVLALGVPIFDTLSVIYIRWRNGESIMKGDKRHFSHRLVDLGMTSRHAVEFIYLVAAVTGLGGALLPQVGVTGTVIILAQTVGVFMLIVLLMNAGRAEPLPAPSDAQPGDPNP